MANDEAKSKADSGDKSPSSAGVHHPILGCLKGMVTIAPGVDLTEPACPELADWIDEKYGSGRLFDD